jgi:hypothetical protein
MKSYCVKVDPNPMTGIKEEEFGQRNRHRKEGHMKKEVAMERYGGRDWDDAVLSQGMPRITGNHHELGRCKDDSFLDLSKEAWPCCHLNFGFL